MAQRDYVSRGRSGARRKKTTSRRGGSSSGFSRFMIMLVVAVLVTFAGGLYFIANNKPAESPVLPRSATNNGNGLPPKPEERWRYIKELENRQLGVPEPTAPNSGGEIKSPVQLTQEQRQLLEQMQADMRRAPTQLSEVPYNDQTPVPRSQVTITAPKTVVVPPVATTPTVTQPPVSTRAPVTAPATQTATPKQETPKQVEIAKQPETPKPEKAQRWMVQCGSFKTLEPAESVRAQLAFVGIESRIASSGGWNRITLGPYKDRATADKMLSHLKDAGAANCIPLAAGG
ncbi:cell division protein FtsN [Candidatus Symbiopectobacterium sp.]|uniref:cell division protein FtsN n=1 Tax=Candidatus Symbiopectobacterium sp. TaxID=2816440 RepID=UPI0025C0674E|nr:cell division protein FtsN [Candidatus Symbiopectobacterium sp.]